MCMEKVEFGLYVIVLYYVFMFKSEKERAVCSKKYLFGAQSNQTI